MHVDLTPSVQTGLGWYYLIVCLANLGYGWYRFRNAQQGGKGFLWFVVGLVFLLLSVLNFAHAGLKLPLWIKDLSDYGLHRGLTSLGLKPGIESRSVNDWIVTGFTVLLWAAVALGLVDLILTYVIGGRAGAATRQVLSPEVRGMGKLSPQKRFVLWLLVISALVLLLYGTNAISFFILSVAAFAALFVWPKTLTKPEVAWGILNFGLFFGGWSMTDLDFREIIIKPDNVPIVGLVGVVGFFTWLFLRRAVINDERIAQGLPPLEKEEDEKVLVWPDLVYTELICMVVVTVVLVIWGVCLPAPLEQPAASTKTPNPSKAPWYFLGLQEMLVYYDPWIAGVVLPTIIVIGLMALPYIDFNQKGNGYFTLAERKFSVMMFIFGFVVLWVTLIFLGTFLRGPNWNFFGLYEPRSPYKLVPLNNVNLSEYFWIQGLNVVWDRPGEKPSVLRILARESPGIILILAYFLVLPPLLAKTVFRSFFIRMGFVRYFTLAMLLLFMASLPIKMVLRWAINLKYIVAIPEYFFNI